jgi:hypothetical protein
MLDVIGRAAPALRIKVIRDEEKGVSNLHAALGTVITTAFEEPETDFVVVGEEDEIVSDDVLEYMRWAAAEFAGDKQVLLVNAHSRGGQGWDEHQPAQDADADQDTVRLAPYFNAWVWGIWRDRWEKEVQPRWDWDCTSGGVTDSGWDWNLATRIVPHGNFVCVVPDASRSQNIGFAEGWASTPESFAFSQAQSFRDSREPVTYRIVG